MKHASGWTLARIGKTVLTLIAAAIGAAVLMNSSCNLTDKAPTVPVITGPSSGVVGVAVTFKATATDPDNDSIAFQFDWGDTSTLAWTSLIASGETTSVTHTYPDSGIYLVKAKTKDQKDKASDWCSPESLQVTTIVRDYPDSLVGDVVLPYDNAAAAVVTADGRFLYVAYAESSYVTPIRLTDRTVMPSVQLGFVPYAMASSPNGDHVYLTCAGTARLYSLRTTDHVIDGDVLFSQHPYGLAVTLDGLFAYVCIGAEKRLMVVRTSTLAIVDSVYLGDGPQYAAIRPDGNFLYVTMARGHLGVVDLSSNSLTDSVPLGEFPTWPTVTPDGQYVYVTNRPDSGLAVIRASDNTPVAHINLHDDDLGPVAMMPDGKYVLASTGHNYGMCVVDAATNSLIDTLPYGYGCFGVHPNGDTVYVPRVNLVHILAKRH
jgi:DNA-binding beta-propeller fold protein YncE